MLRLLAAPPQTQGRLLSCLPTSPSPGLWSECGVSRGPRLKLSPSTVLCAVVGGWARGGDEAEGGALVSRIRAFARGSPEMPRPSLCEDVAGGRHVGTAPSPARNHHADASLRLGAGARQRAAPRSALSPAGLNSWPSQKWACFPSLSLNATPFTMAGPGPSRPRWAGGRPGSRKERELTTAGRKTQFPLGPVPASCED